MLKVRATVALWLVIWGVSSSTSISEITIRTSVGISDLKARGYSDRKEKDLRALDSYLKHQLEISFLEDKKDYISHFESNEHYRETGEMYLPGFGVGYPHRTFDNVNQQTNEKFAEIEAGIRKIFDNNRYEVTGHLRFAALDEHDELGYRTMTLDGMEIASKTDQKFKITIANSGTMKYKISAESFHDDSSLSKRIVRTLTPNYLGVLSNLENNPTSQTRSGLTVGLSAAYSHTFFWNDSIKYGIYTGIEAFGEMTPKAMKSNGFYIKEKEIGLRPFIGVECRDTWRIYLMTGYKMRRLYMRFNSIRGSQTKSAWELGLGTDYLISDRFSIGLKLIKTMKQRREIKKIKFTTTSFKILVSFGVRF